MKNSKTLLCTFFCLLFIIKQGNSQITATQVGMYDFEVMQNLTPLEMNGTVDVTAKLQNAVDASRDSLQALFIPSGTYRISDQIYCTMTTDSILSGGYYRPKLPVHIIGSAINHPTIILSDNSPAFNQTIPKAVFQYVVDPNLIYPVTGLQFNHGWIMSGGIRGLNIDLGQGNFNAIGMYWATAQHTYVEDINIYARDGFAGFSGIGGANALLANVMVDGGQYGIYLPSYIECTNWNLLGRSPQNTITGCTFVNQSVIPLSLRGWGGVTLVGTTIKTSNNIAILLKTDNSVFHFPFSLIDSKIEFTNPSSSNIAISNTGRGTVSLRGTYVLNAGLVCNNNGDEDLSSLGGSNWTKVLRYNYISKTLKNGRAGSTYLGTHYNALTGIQSNTQISDIELINVPPVHLVSQHIWASTPSFEDNNAVLVLPGEDIQAAINTNQVVYLAKGVHTLPSPIILKANTILLGVPNFGRYGTILDYGWTPTQQSWLIETENSAAATTYLMDITTDPGNADYLGSLHWKAGRNSIIRNAWFDVGWDTNEKNMIRLYFSGNGGGRVFNYQDEKGGWIHNSSQNSVNHRKVKISGTSQQLTFYGLNLERFGGGAVESTFPLLEIENSSHVRIFGAKTESKQPYAKLINCTDIFMTNVIDLVNGAATGDKYIEITGAASDSIEISNTMFLKPPNTTSLIVDDPWNTNEVPRTMTLGLYHYNWSSISQETSNSILGIEENVFGTDIFLYPNPTTDLITIELGKLKSAQITIIDLLGRVVFSDTKSTSQTLAISMKNFAKGAYLLNITKENNRRVFYVMKQ